MLKFQQKEAMVLAGFSVCKEKVFLNTGNKEAHGQHWQHPHWHNSEKASSYLLRMQSTFSRHSVPMST